MFGNSTLRSHDGQQYPGGFEILGLTGYLMGSSNCGGDVNASALSMANRLFRIDFETLFHQAVPPATEDGLDSIALILAMVSQGGSQVNTGDYVFIDSARSTHGFMVVGDGPALKCNSDKLASTNRIGRSVIAGSFNVPDDHHDLLQSVELGEPVTVRVPYVVDIPGAQRGTARPFYCAGIKDIETNNWFGGFTFWQFYHVPNRITVPCDRLYIPPYTVNEVFSSGGTVTSN